MIKQTISCGFGKYSISLDKNNTMIIGFTNDPINGEIYLGNLCPSELIDLGCMFLKAGIETVIDPIKASLSLQEIIEILKSKQ